MKTIVKQAVAAAVIIATAGCGTQKKYDMGSYGYDTGFFRDNNIEYMELASADGMQRMLIAPGYQGRVMTTSSQGNEGDSYGWINYKFISEGKTSPQFNPVGGEERFWFGPEGGPYSLYFEQGKEQVYTNWIVPKVIDTEKWPVTGSTANSLTFAKDMKLTNASGTELSIGVERTVSLLTAGEVQKTFGIGSSDKISVVGYRTDNKVTNNGDEAWTKEKGLVSVWLLGMFASTPTTTVFIPYNTDAESKTVNDEYFGKVPSDRLIVDSGGMIYFKIDGEFRSKIGIPTGRAMPVCGSYDTEKKVLTLLQTTLPEEPAEYVNGQWGPQENPYEGDVINSYNDGPTEDGTLMGPFYEIETSSPALALAPGESASHVQSAVHVQGDETVIAGIVKSLFGVELSTVTSKFGN